MKNENKTETATEKTDAAKTEKLSAEESSADSPDANSKGQTNSLADLPEIETKTVIDAEFEIVDPNQAIYDRYNSNKEFAESLTKKETELIGRMIDGRISQASFTPTTADLYDRIVSKFESFNVGPGEIVGAEIIESNDGQESLDEFRRPDSPSREMVKTEPDEIEVPEDKPLTKAERERYDKLNAKAREARSNLDSGVKMVENASFTAMEIAAKVRNGKLYREQYKTIAEWAEKEIGFNPKYAQFLMQAGDFRGVLGEIGKESKQIAGSMNSTKTWMQDTNRLAAQLGIRKSDFETMQPIISAVSQIIEEVATDENGKLNSVAPRIFAAANEKIPEIIETGMVEINGEQMLIKDAAKLGPEYLTENIKTQLVETVGEQILSQKQNFIDYIKANQERRLSPHDAKKPPKQSGRELFVGVVPTYSVECSLHSAITDNYVKAVFNAGFELVCGCKFQQLSPAETFGDNFHCIESDGKWVNYD
jgi:hypothetical protein